MRTLIAGGRVIDPASMTDGELNVLIEDGRIAAVTKEMPEADRILDARGKIVCPGFIDSHIHEDPVVDGHILLEEKTAVLCCMLRMGVTTVLGGNCGSSVCGPADYLDLVDREGAPVNTGMFVGEGYYRYLAGAEDKYLPATEEQIAAITASIRENLQRGCAGVSFGIRYYPGMEHRELAAAIACCRGTGKPVTAHVRDDADAVFDALHEFADAARAEGVPATVSHIGSMAGFGQMKEFLREIDQYRMNGMDLLCDCYPYSAFSTGLGSTTYDDGWLERYRCDYSVLELSEGRYKGQRCTEKIFREERKENPGCVTVCYVMKPEEIELALTHPSVMLVSDATMDRGQGHPRAAGSFPRLIAEYVRTGRLTLFEAIRKMTSMPAERYHLAGKGSLRCGSDADVVIFDLEKIQDHADFTNPILPPSGIDYVLVNGQIAVQNGTIIDGRAGRSVRVPNAG